VPSFKQTPALPAGPLYMRHWDSRGRVHGWRPRGTQDWLFLCTEAGHCLARCEGGEFMARAGDLLLYRPGTPQDYGQHDPQGRWKHYWAHWVPRTPVLEWLGWPELSPGLRHLRLPPDLQKIVRRELLFATSILRSHTPRGELLAANALERALLFCSRANPRESDPRWHPRIQEAVDHLARNLREPAPLEGMARRFGFSRSRFAALFYRQIGQSPRHYREAQRLSQARHLLSYTNQTLTEIADQVGFSSPFYLSLRFKRHYGCSPRLFRQGMRLKGKPRSRRPIA
jgi:AraC family transcriptional regulator of arabinose operon